MEGSQDGAPGYLGCCVWPSQMPLCGHCWEEDAGLTFGLIVQGSSLVCSWKQSLPVQVQCISELWMLRTSTDRSGCLLHVLPAGCPLWEMAGWLRQTQPAMSYIATNTIPLAQHPHPRPAAASQTGSPSQDGFTPLSLLKSIFLLLRTKQQYLCAKML